MDTIKNVVIILIIIIIIIICILFIQPKKKIEHLVIDQSSIVLEQSFAWKAWKGEPYNVKLPVIGLDSSKWPGFDLPMGIGFETIVDTAIGSASRVIENIHEGVKTTIDAIDQSLITASSKLSILSNKFTNLLNVGNITAGLPTVAELAETAGKTICILSKIERHMQNTTVLLESFSLKSDKLSPILRECIIDILTNLKTIINNLLNVDLDKFKGEQYTVTTKLNLIKIRTQHLFNKLGSLIQCINIIIILIVENRNKFEIIKIIKFLLTTLLIDFWKYFQYTIKYNLIDLNSTKPLLKDIFSQDIYKNAINTIIFSSLQMIRGIIDFSEIFIKIAINFADFTYLLLDAYAYFKYLAEESAELLTPPGSDNTLNLLTKMKSDILNIISMVSPLASSSDFGVLQIVTLKTSIKSIRSVLITTGCLIDDDLCNSINITDTGLSLINCSDGVPNPPIVIQQGTIKFKPMIQDISKKLLQCKDTNNLNDYYCKLELIDSIANDVNSIETNIDSAQTALYLSLYTFFINISKPFGWSYEENKTHIEDLINIKKN